MNLVPHYLVKNKALTSDSGTIYVDLPKDAQISVLFFEFNASKTTTIDHSNPIFDQISEISVTLEGSKVAFHAEVEVASIMSWLAAGKLPPHEPRGRSMAEICLPIYFGRYPGDKEYGLDMSLYSSGQLTVPYSIDTTDWNSGSGVYSVWYLRPLQKQNWRGFVRQRTINEFTMSGTAGSEYIDLPHGLPWLRVGVRVYDVDEYLYTNVTALKLTVDDGIIDLLSLDIDDLINLNREMYGHAIDGYAMSTTSRTTYKPQTYLGQTFAASLIGFGSTPNILSITSYRGQQVEIRIVTNAGAAVSTNYNLLFQPTGYCPHGALVLFDGIDKPFPAPQHAGGQIELTVGTPAATIETFLQELVEGRL